MIAPIYQDISRRLEQYIKDHALTGKLPGTRQLSRELGCHHVTLSKAIHLLEQRGLVEVCGVHGVFVRNRPERPVRHVLALVDTSQETPDGRALLARLNAFLKDYGYSMIGIRFDESLFDENPRLLLNFPVDGFLFRQSTLKDMEADLLRQEGIPAVSCACKFGFGWLDQIDCDHETGYRFMLERLKAAGHRRIGWIEFGRCPDYRPYLENIRSYFQAGLGDDFDPELLFIRETNVDCWNVWGEKYCRVYCEHALAHWFSLPEPPTAVIVPSLELCVDMVSKLEETGLRIPEDMSLMCVRYGSDYPAGFRISGLHYDEEKMLFWAVRRLLKRLQSPSIKTRILLKAPVIHRGNSVAAPPVRVTGSKIRLKNCISQNNKERNQLS